MNKPTLLKIARTGLAAALISLGSAGAASAAGLANPTTNRVPSGATLTACMNDPSGADCTNGALADINAARAAEGVKPMVLPANYATLTGPQQLLVLANLERADRGLKVLVVGLAADLNSNAQAAAAADQDPSASPWNGDGMSSNWAGGYDTPLEADFSWMYDDGLGSPNQDCTATNNTGCWGHRDDILMNFDPPLMMGAAVGKGQYGTSITELFVGGDTAAGPGQADAPVGLTWAQISGQPAPSPTADSTPSGDSTSTGDSGSSNGNAASQPTARSASTGSAPAASRPAGSTAHKALCTVPRLRGLPLNRALHALMHAHCGVGQVISLRAGIAIVRRHHRLHRGAGLHVIVQSVRAGSRHHAGFRVTLRVR